MNNETKALSTWAQRSVFVDHREWVGGASTHFSARVYVDGVEVARIPFTYGYGDYFKHCAMQALVTLGIVTGATDHSALWHLRDACGIDVYTATRTASQRDVKAFGAASGSSVHHINIATGCAFAEVRA